MITFESAKDKLLEKCNKKYAQKLHVQSNCKECKPKRLYKISKRHNRLNALISHFKLRQRLDSVSINAAVVNKVLNLARENPRSKQKIALNKN